MQIFGLLFWLILYLLFAKIVNFLAKRPLMNPWLWFGASYAVFYGLGLVLGMATHVPNLASRAGDYFLIVLIAVVLGVWRAPKWRTNQQRLQLARDSDAAESDKSVPSQD